jgi:hypothetical protein
LKGKTRQVDSPVSFAYAVTKIVCLSGMNR